MTQLAEHSRKLSKRKFYAQILFVLLAVGVFVYLHINNVEGEYDKLIIGIIGVFIGSAQTAATQLISEDTNHDEIEENRKTINSHEKKIIKLESNLEAEQKMVEEFKTLLIQLQQKIIDGKITT